jgi:hypothetical protein
VIVRWGWTVADKGNSRSSPSAKDDNQKGKCARREGVATD